MANRKCLNTISAVTTPAELTQNTGSSTGLMQAPLRLLLSKAITSKTTPTPKTTPIMAYSDKLLDHYNNPQNVGTLDKSKTNVGTGLVGAPECGDVMRLQIEVDEESGVIRDAKFKTFGCGSAIASSSLATEWLKGKTVDQALAIDNMELVEELALPPVKIHCSVLAEDAIKAAINDYRVKNGLPALEEQKHH